MISGRTRSLTSHSLLTLPRRRSLAAQSHQTSRWWQTVTRSSHISKVMARPADAA